MEADLTSSIDLRLALLVGQLIHKLIQVDRCEKACQGVTLTQHSAIMAVRRKSKVTMKELSRDLGLAISTITRIVDVLVRDGILERVASQKDRRIVYVILTKKGQNKAARLQECTQRFWTGMLKKIPQDQKNNLIRSLKILLGALESASQPCGGRS